MGVEGGGGGGGGMDGEVGERVRKWHRWKVIKIKRVVWSERMTIVGIKKGGRSSCILLLSKAPADVSMAYMDLNFFMVK